MSDCPYLDSSHSMADLHYVCKAGTHPQKISSREISQYPCFTDKYLGCRRYPDQDGAGTEEAGEK